MVLLGRLIEKMRRAMSCKHLTDDAHGPQIADEGVVLGRIEWDGDRGGRIPLLVIDGREIDWDEFGRMLMSFEGSQFRLNIAEQERRVVTAPSDEPASPDSTVKPSCRLCGALSFS